MLPHGVCRMNIENTLLFMQRFFFKQATKMKNLLWASLVIILVSVLGRASETETPLGYLQGLNSPDHHLIQSEGLGRSFHVFVRLPEGYKEATKPYPVVYLLDGGHTFPMLASYYRYLSFAGELEDLIIVGISYGTDDWKKGNLRSTDFTAAAPNRKHYGGAPNFQKFLETELLPFVEGHYRTKPDRRIIFGQSLGGQFVLYTAQTKPALFWGHIASNPALHRNLDFFLQQKPENTQTSSRLYVAGGSLDDPVFRAPALLWMQYWSGVTQKPWGLQMETLEGEGHFSAAPQSFRRGLKWLFAAVSED